MEPQPKSNFMHFSFKIWHLVATILMIFYHFSEKQLTKTSSLSQNPQEAVIATIICFLTNFKLEITKIQANYWWGQMYCGPPNQNFGCAIAHPAHTSVPPCTGERGYLFAHPTRRSQPSLRNPPLRPPVFQPTIFEL